MPSPASADSEVDWADFFAEDLAVPFLAAPDLAAVFRVVDFAPVELLAVLLRVAGFA
ncbi:hypothetical protein GCM10009854_16490 [Saccharopolyspora halophila]|uniref:Segregation/condensation protein A n=1 Tax=Saccharopolyspora halophila TaxID=405551 RepID=A0ABN3FZ32_9PSEU